MKFHMNLKIPVVIDTELSFDELVQRINEDNIAGIKSVSFISHHEGGSGITEPLKDRILTSILINSSEVVD